MGDSLTVFGTNYTGVTSIKATDHAVVFSASAGPKLYAKQGSAWVAVARAYVKSSGSWQQVSLDQAFDSSKKYVKG